MISKTNGNKIAWFCLKALLLWWWIALIFYVLNSCSSIPLPVSVWKWIPIAGQLPTMLKPVLSVLVVLVALMWLFEKKMTIIAPALAFLSILIFSMEESNGVYNRNMTFSAVIVAIAVAYVLHYYRPQNNLEHNRIQFPTQIIAATYILSGLSKLRAAGFSWTTSGKYFNLQVLKTHFSRYYESGEGNYLTIGQAKVDFIQNNILLLTLLLSFALILELCAWVIVVFPKKKKLYGLLLLAMHIGIYVMMDILILPVIIPMIIVIFNPLYLFVLLVGNVKKRFFTLKY